MFTVLVSSRQVRLRSITNTQGSPWHRLTYMAFADLKRPLGRYGPAGFVALLLGPNAGAFVERARFEADGRPLRPPGS